MDKQVVESAVSYLSAQGEMPSVRKIHKLIGHGSLRDIHKILKELLPEINEEDETLVTPETPHENEATYPPMGTTPTAAQASLFPASRVSWKQVSDAAEAIRQARAAHPFTAADPSVTPERLMDYFYAQYRFSPPIRRWEVWSPLSAKLVPASREAELLTWYVNALRREQLVLSNNLNVLNALWTRIMNP